MPRYIRPLKPERRRRAVGGKTAGLSSLERMGLAVPRTLVCSARAQARYRRGGGQRRFLAGLRNELVEHLDSSCEYAVRSSAALEDGARDSMAGQYESVLRVSGVDSVLAAIQRTWNCGSDRAEIYRARRGSATGIEQMDVLIQEMVDAVSSGVSFSRNPVTGADEVIVEAVEGTSEAFLQRGATPVRWVLGTGNASSDWPALPTAVLEEISRTTVKVSKELRYPADLEWAFDGRALWWLQVRPITSLRGLAAYSNRISREYLPGLVKPLVWSINVPMINGAWVDLFERLVGPLSIDPLSLARPFHFRAYFNMSGMGELFSRLGLPEDALEQVLGLVASTDRSPFGFRWKMLRHLPRLVRFLFAVASFGPRIPRWESRMTARLAEAERALASAGTPTELMNWAEEFVEVMREVARHRIVSVLLHLAVGQLGRRRLQRKGIDDPSRLELADRRLEALDPNVQLGRLAGALQRLPAGLQRRAGILSYEAFFRLDGTQDLKLRFDDFITRFGYISESGNDFSATPWNEDPTCVLRLAAAHKSTEVARPEEVPVLASDRTASRWPRWVTKRRLDRERVGAAFSKGFHLLHCWGLKIGRILLDEGIARAASDVFFLDLKELGALARGQIDGPEASALISQRAAEMAEAASVSLPDVILGDYVADVAKTAKVGELSGIPTSRGTHEGTVCVIRSMNESGRLRDGDVLVVPFSDVAWAPLFARAGAIVAEAGGILSHSSIVAREFGIPAVVSVPNACEQLAGTRVRVNGHEGRITILDGSC
jgi:phosphohistidine swiveling domain-containing protein